MSRQARVGLLVVLGGVFFAFALFVIANRSFLLDETFIVKAKFSRVAGLKDGADVQYQGVNVGRVENVQLPLAPGEKIEVTMAIDEKAQHLLRDNTQAQIKSDGLVGNQIVVLIPATVEAQPVVDGGEIVGVDPFDLFEITDKALVSVRRFEQAAMSFQQIMDDVQNGQGTLGRIVYDSTLYTSFVQTTDETRRVMTTLGDNAEVLVTLAQDATEGVGSILNKIDEGEGTLALMLNDPAVYNSVLTTADTLQAVAADLKAITTNADNLTNWGVLGAYRFAELMEAAKHNWMFKRYFEERGYMEQADFEIRERALEETFKKLTTRERELYEWEQRLQAQQSQLNNVGEATSATVPAAGTGENDDPRR